MINDKDMPRKTSEKGETPASGASSGGPYGKAVAERVACARYGGDLENETVRCEKSNPVCGDVTRISLEINEGVIVRARWKSSGCPPALAAADVVVEIAENQTLSAARKIGADEILARLPDLPSTSRHAVQLALQALHGALRKI